MTHVPLCYNCDEKEVEAPYTFRDGTGFCSASCEDHAYNVERLISYEFDLDLAYQTVKDGRLN